MNKKLIKNILCGALAGIIMVALTGCSNSDNAKTETKALTQQDLLQRIKAKGEIVVGTSTGYPPYIFINTAKGDKAMAGVDVELAQKIADKIGVKLRMNDLGNFSALLASLGGHKADMIIGGIFPTDERKKTMDFSSEYLPTEQKILIRKEDAGSLKTLADFKGKSIGVQKSTTQEKLAKSDLPGSKLVSLDKVPDVVLELKNHKVDGLVVEGIVAEQYMVVNTDLILSDAKFDNGVKYSAIAVNQGGDEAFLKIVNEVIQESTNNKDFEKWVNEYSELSASNTK